MLSSCAISQRQIRQPKGAIRYGHKHIGKAQLYLLVPIGDLGEIADRRSGPLCVCLALISVKSEEVGSEAHGSILYPKVNIERNTLG